MAITIYLKSYPIWPLLGHLIDGRYFVGDREIAAVLVDRYELG